MVNFQKTIYEYKLFRKRISRLNSLIYVVNTYTHILIAINIVYPFYILNASFFPLCIICYYLLLSSLGYSNSLLNVSQFQCILQTVYESDPSKAQNLLKLSKPPLFSNHIYHPHSSDPTRITSSKAFRAKKIKVKDDFAGFMVTKKVEAQTQKRSHYSALTFRQNQKCMF